ncbi:MAG: 1-acyl-sn-glycerol-3-phosphate acyltransferase [Candidatus Terrybacteria bacterium]|nr:1-acyl-sn-glycerol-3-phosphate acyltransferase [Candidatus Terrybacteria bacterium]
MQKIAKIVQTITYWPTYLLLKFFIHYQVEGQENLRGLEDKGVIFASNHASYVDGPISAASMPRFNWYPIRFLALKSYFNWINPIPFPLGIFTALYVRVNGSIPVERTGGDLFKALKEVIKELKNGAKVWIFPEGGITKDGNLRQGKRGVVFLHQQTAAPIVPVALMGTFKILSLRTLMRKNRVKVKIGKPIYSLENCAKENCDLEAGVEKIMSNIAELMKTVN